MTFVESIKTCFGKYATFNGRATRSEYWWWALLNFILSCIPLINFVWGIVTLIPSLAVGVRRLHDIGKSGWFVLLAFVPIVNLYLIYLFICEGQPNANQYGPAQN
ncbi:MAG: DUF805 domain-containing protein [Bacteroidaceae bacterium]|nr:DUF805 domain-containing protein [Bacteroidaceae bacterium]